MSTAPLLGRAAPAGVSFDLLAASGQVCPAVLVTVNAPTDVTAGSRFEARTAEVFISRINGRSPEVEVLQLRSDQPIERVHAALEGGASYLLAASTQVATSQMAAWRFARSAGVRRVDVTLGPAAADGSRIAVRCDVGT